MRAVPGTRGNEMTHTDPVVKWLEEYQEALEFPHQYLNKLIELAKAQARVCKSARQFMDEDLPYECVLALRDYERIRRECE